ncbi:hypothetical protein ABPG72_020427 [Tetrahymena utriculariae]
MQQIQVKTVFLGDANVGKSSILNRFIDDQFDENIQATSGADFKVKSITLNNKKIDFHLWDTAGQERFRSLTQLYYKDASVACIVYDITNRNSFDVLNYWFKELKAHAKENIIKVIIGNKIDLCQQQQVQLDKAQTMAKTNDAVLVLTSAREGTGVQEVFQKIAVQIEQSQTEQIKQKQAQKIIKPQEQKKPTCC